MTRPQDDWPADPPADESRLESLAYLVPDDPRDLADEVAAYRSELRLQRRRARLGRLYKTRRWRQYGISGPLVIAVLLLVAGVGALLVTVRPDAAPSRATGSALAVTDRPAGAIGGLLPDRAIRIDGEAASLRSLRPAVLTIVPPGCGCAAVLDALASDTTMYALHLYVIAPVGEAAGLLGAVSTGQVTAVDDPGAHLASTYDARGVTAVLVHEDGVVVDVVRDLTDDTRLGSRLATLTTPRA